MKHPLIKTFIVLLLLLITVKGALALEVNTNDYVSTFAVRNGNSSAIGDYSVTPGVFKIQPPANETWIITRMITFIEDEKGWGSGSYGKDLTLTNGVAITCNITGELINFTEGNPIKSNREWARMCYDFTEWTANTGSDFAAARWTFAKGETNIKLNGGDGDSLQVVLNDDFSGLLSHTFLFQGFKVGTPDKVTTLSGGSKMIYFGIILSYLVFIILLAYALTTTEQIWLKACIAGSIAFLTMTLTRFHSWFISIKDPAQTNLIGTLDKFFMFGTWGFRIVLIAGVFITLIYGIYALMQKKVKAKDFEL